MKEILLGTLLALCVLSFVSCESETVQMVATSAYELYQYSNSDDAQYVFIDQKNDNPPAMYAWNLLDEDVFEDIVAGNISLPLSNGYQIEKYICSPKVYRSSIKWTDLVELKSNKYAFGEQYMVGCRHWNPYEDTILCNLNEGENFFECFKPGDHFNPQLFDPRIMLYDHFNVEKRPKIVCVKLRDQMIDNLFVNTYGYSPISKVFPGLFRDYLRIYGDEEDVICYPFQKPWFGYTSEERDSIIVNHSFTKKAKDIRADYVRLLNQLIENDELDKYKERY